MTFNNYISIISLLISGVALFYTYKSNTKNYELTHQYRTDILKWYETTITIIMKLKEECAANPHFNEIKHELLAQLSAQIEIGRFYFPNVNKGDNFGNQKPSAYKGHRNLTLDFLMYLYRIFKKENSIHYINHIEVLEREFTSQIFDILSPHSFIKETKKQIKKNFNKNLCFEDFIASNPNNIKLNL